MMMSKKLHKYKSILLSVIIFILLDISVLAFNFYISHQISLDTVKINLAGRQRTLTQRITKNLLEFERAYHKARPYDLIVKDIEESMRLFDNTLNAFDVGGDAVIDERIVYIEPIHDVMGRHAIETAKPMWEIYKNYTADVLEEFKGRQLINEGLVTIFFRESIVKDVVIYTTNNDIALLDVMNDLTEAVERVAAEKTEKLRLFQAVAILFAVINFFVIVFFSIAKLKKTDSELEFATAELDVMLNTIEEGIFLLDEKLIVSEQYSKGMGVIFNQNNLGGTPLLSLLADVYPEFHEDSVQKYLLTLFDPNKNIKVLNVLNPLQKIQVKVKSDSDAFDESKYLRFTYSRIKTDEKIDRVLVRVCDISSEVLQQKIMEEERAKQYKQLRLMSVLMNSNADVLPVFFQRSFYCFDNIGSILKSPAKNTDDLFRKVERIDCLLADFRHEAKRFQFESLLEVADDLQQELAALKLKSKLSTEDFSEISLVLDHLISHTESIYKFSNKILAEASVKGGKSSVTQVPEGVDWLHLTEFAEIVSAEENKQVEVITSGLSDYLLPKEMLRFLNSMILQLIHHSIVISVERPGVRVSKKKNREATIDIRFVKKKHGGYYLTIRNDGAGMDVDDLRATAVGGGAICDTPSDKMDKRQLLSLLFYSYNPEQSKPLSYDGELVFGNEIMDFITQSEVKFDIKSVDGEGSVFEFMFPMSVVDSAT